MQLLIETRCRRPVLAWALLPALMLSACAAAASHTPPTLPVPPAPPAAPTPPAPSATPATPTTPATLPTIPDDAKPIMDRLLKQYAPIKGVTVIARHRIQGQSRVLHESVRTWTFAKPNRFHVEVGGTVIVTSDGNQCWTFDRELLGYNQVPTPQSMTAAMADIPTLGGGSIAGSGGLIAALLAVNPRAALLDNIETVSVFPAGDDDILVLQVRANRGTVRKGTRIGLYVPKTGPAWIAQADIIPQGVTVHTRIVFENWTPSEPPIRAFELDPRALKLHTLDTPEKTTP